MHWTSLHLSETIFTHEDPDTGVQMTWAVTRMLWDPKIVQMISSGEGASQRYVSQAVDATAGGRYQRLDAMLPDSSFCEQEHVQISHDMSPASSD
jgi:hypothetical protein